MRELETFREMHGHQRDKTATRSLFIVPVMIRDERDIFEKRCEILRREHAIIASCHTEKFLYILHLAFVFIFTIFSLEILEIIRPLDHMLHHLSNGSVF